ncbi:hypothetical protein ACF0H5_008209 [Mactra antiquata]
MNMKSKQKDHYIILRFIPMFVHVCLFVTESNGKDVVKIDSSYCEKAQHDYNYTKCVNDDLCGLFNDCCTDVDPLLQLQLTNDQFSCKYVKGKGALILVTTCPAYWPDDQTRTLCEHSGPNDDIMSELIVSDVKMKGRVFKNMHCALCNNVYDYQFWKAAICCPSDTTTNEDLSDCGLYFGEYDGQYRICFEDKVIQCLDFNDTGIVEKCEQGKSLLVYNNYLQFKNKYCAMCNGYESWHTLKPGTPDPGRTPIFSFRMIVDFNKEYNIMGNKERIQPPCKSDQIFDPITGHCTNVICPSTTEPVEGKCKPLTSPENSIEGNITLSDTAYCTSTCRKQNTSDKFTLTSTDYCALSKVKSHEVEYFNKTNQDRDFIRFDTLVTDIECEGQDQHDNLELKTETYEYCLSMSMRLRND